MDKKHLHHIWRRYKAIKPWYFLIAAVVFGCISAYALRANNLHMIELRNKVNQADQQNGDVGTALNNLREYVYAHMNTDLSSGNNGIYPPIQLKYSYDRALTTAQAAAGTDTNSQIYTDAQHECEKQFPQGLSGSGRIPCIQQYISSHGIQQAHAPSASLYEFAFVSPAWSPDLAGWSLVATGVLLALALISFLSDRWMRAELQE